LNDPELRELLRSWEVEPRDDPALARNVWARIEGEQSSSAASVATSLGWLDALARLFARPTMAVAAVALFAIVGAAAGEWNNSRQREARVSKLAAEYAQSIDPILMTHPAEHTGHRP
jgi:hypothetical protein